MLQQALRVTTTREHVIVELKCGHIVHIAPHFCVRQGEEICCHDCDEQKKLESINQGE